MSERASFGAGIPGVILAADTAIAFLAGRLLLHARYTPFGWLQSPPPLHITGGVFFSVLDEALNFAEAYGFLVIFAVAVVAWVRLRAQPGLLLAVACALAVLVLAAFLFDISVHSSGPWPKVG
jgi:hypothetical protein